MQERSFLVLLFCLFTLFTVGQHISCSNWMLFVALLRMDINFHGD